jgi:hypothetical protein
MNRGKAVRHWLLGATLLIGISAPAAAQVSPGGRALAVPADKSWKHAATGMILSPRSAELARASIKDLSESEFDIIASYDDPAGHVVTTFYLYRTLIDDVPLWFDRAMVAMAQQPAIAGAIAQNSVPTAFARPGSTVPSGLRIVIPVGGPELSSTALALVSLDGWLVKVRMSSAKLAAGALDERMSAFIASLRWPAVKGTETPASPMKACNSALRTKKAKVVREDMAQIFLTAALSSAIVKREGPGPVYCREPGATADWGVYRPDGHSDRYVVALGDAGAGLILAPALSLEGLTSGDSGKSHSMSFVHYATTSVLPSFNRLPPAQQAVSVFASGRGQKMSIAVDAKAKE